MAKKRPTLDEFLTSSTDTGAGEKPSESRRSASKAALSVDKPAKKVNVQLESEVAPKDEKHDTVRHMLYLPLPVYDQLQSLMFEEQRGQVKRRRLQEYLHESIDLLFKDRGLKSIADLTGKE
jgi:hypothetical protein